MPSVTRSSVRRVHFTPKPGPTPRTVPASQVKLPKTPRKRKASRGVLPAGAVGPLAAMTTILEMSPAGQAQFNRSLPLNGSPVNFEEEYPGDSPSPTSNVIKNRRRRSGTAFPTQRFSLDQESSGMGSASPEMPSSPPVIHRNRVPSNVGMVTSESKCNGRAFMTHVEIPPATTSQSRKRKPSDDSEPELAPAAKITKTRSVEKQRQQKTPAKAYETPKPAKKQKTMQKLAQRPTKKQPFRQAKADSNA